MTLFTVRILIALAWLSLFAQAQRLSTLAPPPVWSDLEVFQETITHDEFRLWLETVYAPAGAAAGLIEIQPTQAIIRTRLEPPQTWTLRFTPEASSAKPAPRLWHRAEELGAAPPGRPLAGLKIALDPGHLGGDWAQLEERWFKIGDSLPVTEGDMTLRVAQLIAPRLRDLGAEVQFVRDKPGPTTPDRPETLLDAARAQLALQGVVAPRETYQGMEDPQRASTVQSTSELLFYRISEIRHRAKRVNEELHPDLTICLHFDAESWGNPQEPDFVPRNHLHALINGCYSAVELRNDDIRFELLFKLLSRCYPVELAANQSVVAALARATQLPAFEYPGDNARSVSPSHYVWTRNLLANRLYRTPVIFLEPYVMNSREVWERVQIGDYAGEKMVAGRLRKSLFAEYADAVVEGLTDYSRTARDSE